MDFDLTEEQGMLADGLARLLAARYDFETRRRLSTSPEGWSRDLWRAYADMGLLGLPFAEEDGGFGGGAVDCALVMEAFGRVLALEPYLATIVLGGGVLRHAASPEQRAELVPLVAVGELLLALAHTEPRSGWALADIAATATAVDGGWAIDGEKSLALHGAEADMLIVAARVAGARRDEAGIGLFLVPADAPGVTRRGYRTQDGARAADITFADVRIDADAVLGDPEGGFAVLERVIDEAIAATASEAVGAMQVALDMTVEYLKTRTQFGQKIGAFQALQHRAADMFVALEQARSMALYATMMVSEPDRATRRTAISAAKVQVGRSARFIGQQAVQLHGGIGTTDEYAVGHLFKRLTTIEMMWGDSDHHLGIVAASGGLLGAA